jgi:cysteinylglycine-S-conjugate dipeptidase
MSDALEQAYGRPATTDVQGGSTPLQHLLRDTFPGQEILLPHVEEPRCLIRGPNESVAPSGVEQTAVAEALFPSSYAAAR